MIPLCTYRLFCISVITGMLSLKFKVVFNITFLNILLQWSQLSFGWSCDLDFFNPAPAGTPKLLQKWLPQPQRQGQAKWLVLLGCNWLDPPSPWGNELILPPLLLSIKRTQVREKKSETENSSTNFYLSVQICVYVIGTCTAACSATNFPPGGAKFSFINSSTAGHNASNWKRTVTSVSTERPAQSVDILARIMIQKGKGTKKGAWRFKATFEECFALRRT